MVDRFAADWRQAGLDEQTNALLEFTERLTEDPSAMEEADIERLRSRGLADAAISSAVQVVAYFNYINRIAEGLGVPMEDWLHENGRPRESGRDAS